MVSANLCPDVRGDGIRESTVALTDLDAASVAEWVDGFEKPIAGKPGQKPVVWTRDDRIELGGVTFGESAKPGPRHLRIGFRAPVKVGTVLTRGGGRLSVLKADADRPGASDRGVLDRDSDWVTAERVKGSAVVGDEASRDELVAWVLPPETSTRALRFTHVADASDPKYGGWLGGALLLPDRLANVAPQAVATAGSHDEQAALLNNGLAEQWNAWDNGKEGGSQAVSAEHPEWVMLTWPRLVPLVGLQAVWAGFGSADVQAYAGPADRHPKEAADADWKSVGHFDHLENGYPINFWPSALPFGQTVTTRAIRVRMTSATTSNHPHLKNNMKDGRRVWLGELMALRPLGEAAVASAVAAPVDATASHPPIPVRFTLPEAGYVTLVVEDSAGKRVRNLVSETPFPAGDNVAWWDGTDDLGRDRDAAKHGLYHVPEQPVAPGSYRVRGLFHKGLDLRYEFSIYNAGTPAWSTADTTGGWLTNHSPPQAALFVPAEQSPTKQPTVYLGSAVSEGGAGLAWVDESGKKLGGRGWIGGNWTAAPHLARDAGPKAVAGEYAYVGSTWTATSNNRDRTKGELRLTALSAGGDRVVVKHPFSPPPGVEGDDHWVGQLGGIAARDGLLVASLTKLGRLVFVDARTGKALGEEAVASPRGITFDSGGKLLVLSGKQLVRFAIDANAPATLATPPAVVVGDLEDPHGVTLDAAGAIYVSDHGASHQVKVYSPDGKLLRTIGKPGAPTSGAYDPLHLNHPFGLAVDGQGQLWVTEHDFRPKRVSVWSADGKLVKAFYGPGRYGGGGSLDPRDRSRFYYDGIEFKLDWATGASVPASVFYRDRQDELGSQSHSGPPETPIYVGGRQYLTNCYNSNPTGGHGTVGLWLLKDGVAVPVASCGRASDWDLLRGDAFKSRWPAGIDPKSERNKGGALFVWSDGNGDGKVQPDEVAMTKAAGGGVTVGDDLSFLLARADEKAIRLKPTSITPGGVPLYDVSAPIVLAEGAQSPASSGGDQALVTADGWTVLTVAPKPYAKEGFSGLKDGVPMWSYPSLWPGLHASHEAPVHDRPGEVIGSTRLLGGLVTPKGSDAGPLWCVNGNAGTVYLFTVDGLFVGQLFQDSRAGKPWSMPSAERNMRLNDVTLHDENFFPTITQTADGKVYLCDGARTSLVRVDGLDAIRRLPAAELKVSADDLAAATAWRVEAEAKRQADRGTGTLTVAIRKAEPTVDGKLDDWAGAEWAPIDRRGVAAFFNSDSKPYDVSGAVAVAGDRLYAAFRTADAELLKNSGETPNAPFKTGGCLDLMIGADPSADPKRPRPAASDQRLLVTQVGGKTVALLYRAVVPGTKEPVPFSSPWRTIKLDRVDDVSADVRLAVGVEKDDKGKVKSAVYELSVPLASLGLKPTDGASIKGDLGVLRGNGFQTTHRVYWNNKATAITADVPSEAELTPALWGRWTFRKAE